MKIAVVHEWLVTYAGSERVCEQMLQLYPEADLFSLVDFLPEDLRFFIQHRPVTTSFLQYLPFANPRFRAYLPLMPLAIERFDLSPYDVVLSSHHAVAKGVMTRADQLHISYVHTPIRYAWEMQQQYFQEARLRGPKAAIAQGILHYLRLWDVACANRVDHFIANSRFVARRIWKTYRRPAEVIYPPVAVDRFSPAETREDFYFTLSRFVPYKRVDLVVEAFTQLGLPLVVIGDGSEFRRVAALAGPTVRLLGRQPDDVVRDHMQRCKAFVYPAEEDFGIAMVEAQAAGAPVIGYGRGGAAETVIPGKTGILLREQTVAAIVEAVRSLEAGNFQFHPDDSRQNAERFSPERFRAELAQFVDQQWAKFQQG
ncbi:glycosyltransferase family 4 protein [Thermoleptolyngbya oregonensis NK1-22]|uniref:Glycosyltransferase family 4 protein n=1 Tax=Thermoleptolyngbya oregonensis NK1-22 TaxID=2547457 RepID=A0AA96YE28_9CYAN|nr:glycosyltransferase family 4 protein [Thermoleptolyngbya oregonensis]WOB45110.1 glycosyltransferase family 4 protein [Thermoleptolyngbya oregonensis NK1-22]